MGPTRQLASGRCVQMAVGRGGGEAGEDGGVVVVVVEEGGILGLAVACELPPPEGGTCGWLCPPPST